MFCLCLCSVLFAQVLGAPFYYGDAKINSNQFVVETKNGKILGQEFITLDKNKFPYLGFQGIPFAEPPVGENRFRPPQPKKNWDGILNATDQPAMCMQPVVDFFNVDMSEDCLYLNVYSPKLNGSLPVMVWIYGGAFILGSSAKDDLGPDYLIQENIVIVTLNYRLGIFGFLSTQDEVIPGNYGLKDQILALKWVQENIRSFGGNPDSVTIFGESAGAASVSLLLHAKSAAGLFHGAIMESGVSLSLFSRTRNPRQMAFSTGELLGIFVNNSQDLVTKLRNINPYTLLTLSSADDAVATYFSNPEDGLYFAPTIEPDHDGAVITGYVHEQLENCDFNIVPLIVGFNSAEGNPFASAVNEIPFFLIKFDLDPKLVIPVDMNANISKYSEIGSIIKTLYFGNESVESQIESLSAFITDDQFKKSTNEFVRLVSKVTPTFYYEFSYVVNPDDELPGVGHGDELPFLWETSFDIGKKAQPTRRKLIKMWTNFAKYRNPTPEVDEDLDKVIWAPSNSQNFSYLEIESKLTMKTNPRKQYLEFWSELYKSYGNPPYDTY